MYIYKKNSSVKRKEVLKMVLHRCAACGSPRVVMDKQAGGYSYSKGVLGSLLLGSGGAAAGMNGKTQTVYKCPDCGQTLTYCMPEAVHIKVEMALANPDFPLEEWKILKSQYKNLEDGAPDLKERLNAERQTKAAKQFGVTFNSLVQDIGSYIGKFGYFDRHQKIYDIAAGKLPSASEYQDICVKAKKFILQLHKFESQLKPGLNDLNVSFQYEDSPHKFSVGKLFFFVMALDYYEETGKAMPVSKESAVEYFKLWRHLERFAPSLDIPDLTLDPTSFHLLWDIPLHRLEGFHWFGFHSNLDEFPEGLKDEDFDRLYRSYIFPTLIIKDGECIVNEPVY